MIFSSPQTLPPRLKNIRRHYFPPSQSLNTFFLLPSSRISRKSRLGFLIQKFILKAPRFKFKNTNKIKIRVPLLKFKPPFPRTRNSSFHYQEFKDSSSNFKISSRIHSIKVGGIYEQGYFFILEPKVHGFKIECLYFELGFIPKLLYS